MTQIRAAFPAAALSLALTASGAAAVDLTLPASARVTVQRSSELDRYAAPVAPWDGSEVPRATVEGAVSRTAWRIDGVALTPLQLVVPLRQQLEDAGYRIVLDCPAQTCGGFDFRFAVDVLPAPAMSVGLRDYHVITGLKGPPDKPEAAVNVIASRRDAAAFVQIITAGENANDPAEAPIATGQPVPEPDALEQVLRGQGHAVLRDLEFDTGTSSLGEGPFASLRELARILRDAPDLRLALVGHTDSVGALETNIALSRERARAVRARLISAYGIDPARLDAEGMGYLSPISSNDTAEGREANRRVEAVALGG
ncbi:OmpA family protein [Sulfitobacter sp. HNIBRBA3233]|uniref:OmpA family protein n=1 Tax=Sulfitobacter marinivivus TaxID=3158558 RepID=UPI0032DF20C4